MMEANICLFKFNNQRQSYINFKITQAYSPLFLCFCDKNMRFWHFWYTTVAIIALYSAKNDRKRLLRAPFAGLPKSFRGIQKLFQGLSESFGLASGICRAFRQCGRAKALMPQACGARDLGLRRLRLSAKTRGKVGENWRQWPISFHNGGY